MPAVRFSCGDASEAERAELAEDLAALGGTEVLDSGEGGGAAFADIIIVAIITAGTPVLYDSIKTFGKWLGARKSRKGQVTDGPVRVVVEGLRGSCTITINSETKVAELDLGSVGTVTEIREAE